MTRHASLPALTVTSRQILPTLFRLVPRGRFRLARMLTYLFPRLRQASITLTLLPDMEIKGDISESVWFPLWLHGHYPHQLVEDIVELAFLRPGDVVFDVGANIGYKSLLYASAVGTNGFVVAFEPSPRCGPFLRAMSRHAPNVTVLPMAVSDRPGKLSFCESASLDLSSVTTNSAVDLIEVQATSLDQWSRETNHLPSFIKIDAEGHDLQVLQGARHLIAQSSPIIEYEALSKTSAHANRAEILASASKPYTFYRFDRERPVLRAFDEDGPEFSNNYLAVPEHLQDRFASVV